MEAIISQIFGGFVPLALLTFGFISFVLHNSNFQASEIKDYEPEDWDHDILDHYVLKIKDVQFLGGNRRNIVYEIYLGSKTIDKGARFISKEMNPFDPDEIKSLFNVAVKEIKFGHKYAKIKKADNLTNKIYKHRNDNWTEGERKKFQRLLNALDQRVDELEKIDLRTKVYKSCDQMRTIDWEHVADLYHDIDMLCRYFERNFARQVFDKVEKLDGDKLRATSADGRFTDQKDALFFNLHVKKTFTEGEREFPTAEDKLATRKDRDQLPV